MAKPLKPTDGRLKANRDFSEFMMRAVHIPSMQRAKGEFRVEAGNPVRTIGMTRVPRPGTDVYKAFADDALLLALFNYLDRRKVDSEAEAASEIAAELYWRCGTRGGK